MLFSPAVGFALVLPAVGYALVLPAVGYALSVLLIFHSCWVRSSRGHRTRVASLLHPTTDSLAEVLSLLPPALLASFNTTTQHCATS